MIGLINLSWERFVVATYGEEVWHKVLSHSKVDGKWISSCPYEDEVTYSLAASTATVVGMSVDDALEAFGDYFLVYALDQGYGKVVQSLGSTIVEFLRNLNNLHLHLSNGQPAMNPPQFRVDQITPTSCRLHYFSSRPGLWALGVGVLKGLHRVGHFNFPLKITLLTSRDRGDDHETFRIEYPEQALGSSAGGSGPPTIFTLNPVEFATLHPFHMLLDKECRLIQFGATLLKLVPGIAVGVHLSGLYMMRHPHTEMTWDGILRETASSFVLLVPSSGMELKGQMVETTVPVPGCPVAKPALLFLGSPRCANLEEMLRAGLYQSDIPLHDLSRDFVLLAEQRQAEADLKEKFERLTLELKAEKARSDALVQRMSNLLACFPFKGRGAGTEPRVSAGGSRSMGGGPMPDDAGTDGVRLSPTGSKGAALTQTMHSVDETFGRMEVIEAVRRTLAEVNLKQSEDAAIEILRPIGEGTYGKVYCGLWQGTDVAIKTIILPAGMSGAQKREKMAIVETAISSSLSHPNIVQTYTYTIRPVKDAAAREDTAASSVDADGSIPDPHAVLAYEVRLVLELCDKGSLRHALEQDVFRSEQPGTGTTLLNFPGLLDTAMDVAKACIHLHRNNVVHSDLKARNVLLRSSGDTGRGFIAKLGDFGLAVKLPEGSTFSDGAIQGTLTHMAPEVLMHGRASKASDVYAYGILLWELYTGGHVFEGVPKALLIHQVTAEHRRPEFPPSTPYKYQQLAQWCWNKEVHVRPTFEEVLSTLLTMRRELGGPTPQMKTIRPPFISSEGLAGGGGGSSALPHDSSDAGTAKQLSLPSALPDNVLNPRAHVVERMRQCGLGASVSFMPSDSDDGYGNGDEDDWA